MSLRVGIYSRKSTEQKSADARELSTVRQIEACRAVCEKRGWSVVGVYDEGDGISGTKGQDKRPQLARLLADALAGKLDVIVALNRDRLSRQGPASWAHAARNAGRARGQGVSRG
jgi:site-specific DNA recombinase